MDVWNVEKVFALLPKVDQITKEIQRKSYPFVKAPRIRKAWKVRLAWAQIQRIDSDQFIKNIKPKFRQKFKSKMRKRFTERSIAEGDQYTGAAGGVVKPTRGFPRKDACSD